MRRHALLLLSWIHKVPWRRVQDLPEPEGGGFGFFGDLGGVDDDLGGALEVRDRSLLCGHQARIES